MLHLIVSTVIVTYLTKKITLQQLSMIHNIYYILLYTIKGDYFVYIHLVPSCQHVNVTFLHY